MQELRDTFDITSDAEVTFEMDPGTFTYERLNKLRDDCGINRISMGVQSFDADSLKLCGRPHGPDDTIRALKDLQKADWTDFSIDLISSLPHMTIDKWIDTLEQTITSDASHISVYDLQVEEKTAFDRWYTPGEFPLPSDDLSADMYRTAVRMLTNAGYEHYEVSNYAKPGHRSRHNQKYWRCAPVWAFGMSAVSYLRGERFERPRKMEGYVKFVEELQLSHGGIRFGGVTTTTSNSTSIEAVAKPAPAPDILEAVMLSLRTKDGLNLTSYRERYGLETVSMILEALLPYSRISGSSDSSGSSAGNQSEQALVEVVDETGNLLAGTDVIKFWSTVAHHSINQGGGGFCSDDINTGNAETVFEGISHNPAVNEVVDCLLNYTVRLNDPEGFLLSNEIISSIFAKIEQ